MAEVFLISSVIINHLTGSPPKTLRYDPESAQHRIVKRWDQKIYKFVLTPHREKQSGMGLWDTHTSHTHIHNIHTYDIT